MDLGQVVIPEEVRFHMLRHFQQPSTQMLVEIKAAGKTDAEIGAELSISGSRFFPAFASSPEEVISHLATGDFEKAAGMNGNWLLHATVCGTEFPSGVGSLSVLPLEELTENQKEKLYIDNTRGAELWHLRVEKLPPTWEYTAIIKPSDSGMILLSAFPGPAGMPVPAKSMNNDLYEHCRAFWENHVFLVQDKND